MSTLMSRTALTTLILILGTACDLPLLQAQDEASPPNGEVLNLRDLTNAETFEDLRKYGLLPPDQHDHRAGSNLVLLGLKATAFFKGDWVMAHGLLGVTMLDVDVFDGIALRSLFLSLAFQQGFKMYASHSTDDNALLMDVDEKPRSSKSIMTRREAIIYAVSNHLNGRYIYNDAGNFGRNYSPEPNRRSNEKLMAAFRAGLDLLQELAKAGFEDGTLRDTLGMAYASLEFDKVEVTETRVYTLLGPLQVYRDALNATLAEMKGHRDHSYEFLIQVAWQMQARGLAAHDELLLPEEQSNHQAILKIVEADLQSIKRQ